MLIFLGWVDHPPVNQWCHNIDTFVTIMRCLKCTSRLVYVDMNGVCAP